jgi:hypothetical protein
MPVGNQAGQDHVVVTSCPENNPWLLFQKKFRVGYGRLE